MSSRLRDDRDKGQLAVMDAIVFFTVAMLICSLQLAQLRGEVVSDDIGIGRDARSDPSTLLMTILRTSIGQMIMIELDTPLTVSSETAIADCLASEAVALTRGHGTAAFEELNRRVLAIVSNASAPVALPHIVMAALSDGEYDTMLVLEHAPIVSENCFAATQRILSDPSRDIVVTLVLEPTSLPEILGV